MSSTIETATDSSDLPPRIIQFILRCNGDPRQVVQYLRDHVAHLTEALALDIRAWATHRLSQPSRDQDHMIALGLTLLGRFMAGVDFGSRADNLEIALASSDMALRFLSADAPSDLIPLNHQSLGYVYRNRVRGERADNIESAIQSYRAASDGYCDSSYAREWAQTQNDLGNAYSDRIDGDRADNLARALDCYQNALLVFTAQSDPEVWAKGQWNLGITYYQSIRGDRQTNLRRAAVAYESAATVFTPQSSPDLSRRIRSSLLTVYREMLLAGDQEHLDRISQLSGFTDDYQFFGTLMRTVAESRDAPAAALPFLKANAPRLTDAFATVFATFVRNDVSRMSSEAVASAARDLVLLGNLLTHLPFGNPAEVLEIAIASLGCAQDILTREAAPRRWAGVQAALGEAYLARIRGDRIENLKSGLSRFQDAAEVFASEPPGDAPAKIQESIGMTLKDLGIAYRSRSPEHHPEARQLASDCFEQAITTFGSALARLPPGATSTRWASIQDNLANAYQQRMLGDPSENLGLAIAARESSLRFFTKEHHPRDWALVQLNLGADCRRLAGLSADAYSKLQRAISCYHAALEVFTREDDPGRWASIQNNLGNAYRDLRSGDRGQNLKLALSAYAQSLAVYRRDATTPELYAQIQQAFCDTFLWSLLEALSGDSPNNQSIYSGIQDYLPVLDAEILTRVWERRWAAVGDEVQPEQRQGFAAGLLRVCALFIDFPVESKATYVELAIIGLKRAVSLFRSDGNTVDWAESSCALGSAYANRLQGDHEDNIEAAITCFQSALSVFDPSVYPGRWIECQRVLGAAYLQRRQGGREENIELAIRCLEPAAGLALARHDLGSLSSLNNVLGMAYGERLAGDRFENLERAISRYREALTTLSPENAPKEWASIQHNLGIALSMRGASGQPADLSAALESFERAASVFTPEVYPEQWARLQGNVGRLHSLRSGEIDKAIAACRAALTVFTPATYAIDCLRVARSLGDTAFDAGRWSDAVEGYEIAVEALERHRSWAASDQRKQAILESDIAVYAQIVESLLRRGDNFRALQYVERSKAQNLVDLMGNRDLYPKGGIAPAVIAELDRLRREIAAQQRRVTGESRVGTLRQALNDLIDREIQPLDPVFKVTQKVEALSHQGLLDALPDKTTVLVEWYLSSGGLNTFVVLPDRAEPVVLTSSADDREGLVRCVESYLEAYTNDNGHWHKTLATRLADLAALLQLDRLLALIPNEIDQIVFVPHRFLHILPIHALPCTSGGQLLDRFPKGIRYAPSIQLLLLTQRREQPAFDTFFGIQNPTGDLSYSDLEVQSIRRRFAPNDEVLEGNHATKDRITGERLQRAACVHFSTHAAFDFVNPLESALILADSVAHAGREEGGRQGGPPPEGARPDLEKCLTLADIFAFDLRRCRLVTLSACETGLIDPRSSGDEYIGLPSGFLYAGTPAVVSTLWTVSDLATALIMIRFYDNLDAGNAVSLSLNEAQRWLRDISKAALTRWVRERKILSTPETWLGFRRRLHACADDAPPFGEPYYWAGFCAIGR